jgi:hypothetical protein
VEVEAEARSECWRNRHRNRSIRVERDRARNPERIVLAVPFKNPTFVVRPGLKEPSRQERPGKTGARRVERVTGTNFNPIMLIVKLRNILGWKNGKGKQKNRRAARTECPRRPEEN